MTKWEKDKRYKSGVQNCCKTCQSKSRHSYYEKTKPIVNNSNNNISQSDKINKLNEINESFKKRDKIDINSILELIDENDENEDDYSINANKYYELEIDSGAAQWFQRE